MLQYEQGRNTQEDPPPWLWLPPQDPIALPLTVRRGFCKAREEEEQEGSGKLELPPFPEIIISGNQTDEGRERQRRHAKRREKGSPPPAEQRKLLNHRALLSPPSRPFLTAQRCTFAAVSSAASLYFAIHLEEEPKVKDLSSRRGSWLLSTA